MRGVPNIIPEVEPIDATSPELEHFTQEWGVRVRGPRNSTQAHTAPHQTANSPHPRMIGARQHEDLTLKGVELV